MKSELNTRQWKLYEYLKEKGNEWTYQWQIALEIPEYGYNGEEDYAKFHDSPVRHALTKDIQAINKCTTIQKIVLSSPKGIKLASESDFEVYIRSQYAALWRKKERIDKIAKKGSKDGQMKIVFGSERDTVKSFIDSDKAVGNRLKELRQKYGFSQNDIVIYLGNSFDSPMLSKFENGLALPNKTTLLKLADIYGVTPEYILTGINLSGETIGENNDLQVVKGGKNA